MARYVTIGERGVGSVNIVGASEKWTAARFWKCESWGAGQGSRAKCYLERGEAPDPGQATLAELVKHNVQAFAHWQPAQPH